MKKVLKRFFILFAILQIFVGCQNPSESLITETQGIGYFSVSFANENTMRTILPATPSNTDFAEYELKFFKGGTNDLYISEVSCPR